MTDPLTQMPGNLGANLGRLRESRNWTQGTLAQAAGIPRSTVTHMESGSGNPSLLNLLRVAQALSVSVEELLSRPRPRVKQVRRGEIPEVTRDKVKVRKLLPDPIAGMEMDRMDLGPGARMRGTPHLQGTREYLYCERGHVRVYVDGQRFDLEAGEVLAFEGHLPHAYENPDRARRAHTFSVVVLS